MILKSNVLLILLVCLGNASMGGSEFTPKRVEEVFFTGRNHEDNVDSMATWRGSDGQAWLISTCKGTHNLRLENALNGDLIRRTGGLGILPGKFNRPNGISVVENMLLVVERDNRRVQVISLPEMVTVATFGEGQLVSPYGLYVQKMGTGEYTVYVTDSYQGSNDEPPSDKDLDKRVKVYSLTVDGNAPQSAEGKFTQSFGETTGAGRLLVVESIYGDPANNRLMIAEEEMKGGNQCVKVYFLDGKFSGKTLGKGLFRGQPEGIALYQCEDGSGYWIFTDQGKSENYFHLFDRKSLEYIGSFYGPGTLNTDGIWLDAQLVTPRYPMGLFYALQNDGNVAAFDWSEVLKSLGLTPCP